MAVNKALELLEAPPPPPSPVQQIDFNEAGLTDYAQLWAVQIDGLFTPSECGQLLAAAQSTTNDTWSQAMVNVGGGRQKLYTDIRDCGRIIWDSPEIAEKLWKRIEPLIDPSILTLTDKARVTGNGPVKRKEIWRATRLNERLRFLKYEKGQYFHEHCDGSYVTPDGKEMSFVTVHVYLNGGDQDSAPERLQGGSTKFISMDFGHEIDVNPRMGSVLVFQHRGLLHSGDEVKSGVKYTLRTDLMYEKMTE
ncbi:MAG: hypothetical protein Q9227_003327 [Pyrenula ochraceoflavens]